jgi:hypothetical protein
MLTAPLDGRATTGIDRRETDMQAFHTPTLATDRIADLRREADRQRLASNHRDDRDPAPQPQPWPRLFLGLLSRIVVEPMRVELR